MDTSRHIYFISMLVVTSLVPADAKISPLIKRVLGETFLAEPTWFCVQRLKAGSTWKTISSPGYPKALNMKHSRCTWKITASRKLHIRIAFRGIDLHAEDTDHCASNYIEIIDEVLGKSQARMCGRKTSGDIVSQGNKLRMDLQRDPSEKYQRGFSVSVMATKAKPGFYPKKSFNEKPLPPLRRPKTKDPDEKPQKSNKKESDKKSEPKSSGHMMITSDGQLVDSSVIQDYPKKRQINRGSGNDGFKRLGNGSGAGSGMSTLTIIGIVVGGVIGLVIIFLILRKLIMSNRNKNKENDSEVVQSNSGLPKINMTHDNVVSAKRNILGPTVVVGHAQNIPPLTHSHQAPPVYFDSDSNDSDPPPDYRKLSTNSHNGRIRSKASHFQQQQHNNNRQGMPNGAYQNDQHDREVHQRRVNSRMPNERRSGRRSVARNASPTRKTPYRYNSKRTQGLDQRRALEALNNEQFCEYDSMYMKPQQRQSHIISTQESRVFDRDGNVMPKFKSRHASPNRRKGSGDEVSLKSEDSDVFLPKSPNKSKFSNHKLPNFNYEKDRQDQHHGQNRRTQDRLKGSRSKTLDIEITRSKPKDKKGSTKRNTIEGTTSRLSQRESRKEDGRRRSEKRKSYISDKDYNINGEVQSKNRFNQEKQFPNLPRHIVPSSRR